MTHPHDNPGEALPYRRCRFSTLIPCDRRYTPDHYWLQQEAPGVWRAGFSPWAVRLLGDLVEYRFDIPQNAPVTLHQPVGTLEGFKAAVEIRAVAAGMLTRTNPLLAINLDVLAQDPCGEGWLYLIEGTPDPDTCDAAAYRLLLDRAVDALRGSPPPGPA